MKKVSKCETNSSKSNLHKDRTKKDGFNSICSLCRKGFYNETFDQIIEYRKMYAKQNRAKINIYDKKNRETDFNFKLAGNMRSRRSQTFKSQNVKKINKDFHLLGCTSSFLRNWI